jgi:hypothetical protein
MQQDLSNLSMMYPQAPLWTQLQVQKVKTTEREGVGAHSLAHNTSKVEGRAGALGWD